VRMLNPRVIWVKNNTIGRELKHHVIPMGSHTISYLLHASYPTSSGLVVKINYLRAM
jgi:hypothetical protein